MVMMNDPTMRMWIRLKTSARLLFHLYSLSTIPSLLLPQMLTLFLPVWKYHSDHDDGCVWLFRQYTVPPPSSAVSLSSMFKGRVSDCSSRGGGLDVEQITTIVVEKDIRD